MNNKPLISIIITCYNYGNFVRDALQSAQNQTFKNNEIIIVDDGSTNYETISTLKNINKEGVNVFFQQNKGPSAARNFGIQKSSGQYIVPLDADDILDKNFVEKSLEIIKNNDGLSPVYCDVQYFGSEKYIQPRKEWCEKDIYNNNFILISSMFSKKAWLDCNGFDENLIGLEDWDLWVSMAKKGYKGKRIPEVLLYVRKHEQSNLTKVSSNKDSKGLKKKYIKLKHGLGNKYKWIRYLGLHLIYMPWLKKTIKKI